MRELKFRAWDKDVVKYVDGVSELYVDILEVGTKTFRIEQMCPGRYIIEQYTALKDKNGKEIYEGDILESTWNGDRAVVVWNDVEGEWEHYADFNTHSKYSGSVVIGNIHENPELLEEEE